MNLYLISQTENNEYDTYDSAVVAAETEDLARMTHPHKISCWDGKAKTYDTWTSAENVTVELLGTADRNIPGVTLASFNAGQFLNVFKERKIRNQS